MDKDDPLVTCNIENFLAGESKRLPIGREGFVSQVGVHRQLD